jgi:hypothetical protein
MDLFHYIVFCKSFLAYASILSTLSADAVDTWKDTKEEVIQHESRILA